MTTRIGFVALWITQIATAAMFLLSGGLKLAGAPAMVGLFDAIGVGQTVGTAPSAEFLRLTFGADGKLTRCERVRH